MKKAVVLFNLGGPDKLENVKPFLFNLFNDPAILNLPTFLRYPLAKIISNRRTPVAKKIYEELGGSSPILRLTKDQSNSLEKSLNQNENNDEYKCFIVMRCWHPRAEEVIKNVQLYDPEEIILMPLYPQYSAATSGSSIKEWKDVCKKNNYKIKTSIICCYPTDQNFINAHINEISKKNNSSTIKISKNEKERLSFWIGRKAAFPACGAMAPDYYCMDGSIPRGKLAEALKEINKLSIKYNLPVANCFHAGDGNLHPLIMFDGSKKDELKKTEEFGSEILKMCVKFGGVLTGEHGVGIEKRELMCEMFNDNDIQQQIKIKKSLDEKNLLNPGKVYPILRKCAEEGRIHVHRDGEKFPDLPRF